MKLTVMEISKRMGNIHHEWKVAVMTGVGVGSLRFTVYRGKCWETVSLTKHQKTIMSLSDALIRPSYNVMSSESHGTICLSAESAPPPAQCESRRGPLAIAERRSADSIDFRKSR